VSLLDRYLLREILLPLTVGLCLFFVIVCFGQVLKVSDSVTGLGITTAEILNALAYSLPPLMGLLLPVSGLFATLLGIGRIAADRELVALSACGLAPYRLLRVPLLVAGVLAIGSAASLILGEPWGVRGLRALMARSAQTALTSGVQPGEFHQWVPGVTVYAQARRKHELVNVIFSDRRNEMRPVIISAKRGEIRSGARTEDIVFDLKDGSIVLFEKSTDSYRIIDFDTSRYLLDVGEMVGNKARTVTWVQGLSLLDLWRASREPATPRRHALVTVTLHRRLALPFATLIFVLLAVPLACRAQGGARARGFLYSAAIIGAYYYIGRAAELSSRTGSINPVLAAWLPNLIGAAVAVVLLWRFPRRAV
jgi:lipopolysaccharide export system permease protein